MSGLLQQNATLTAVRRAVPSETYDDAEAGAPATVWEGSVPAYYQEKRDRSAGALENLVVRRSLIILSSTPAELLESEQTLEFAFAGANTTGTINAVERRALAGMPAGVQTTRITLEET